MSGSRGSETLRRQPVRGPKPVLKSSTVDSEQPHLKLATERSPKMGDRRSPRDIAKRSSEQSNQKKLGNRVADLESQLGQARGELKVLKRQIGSTGVAKRAPIKPKNPVGLNESSDEIQPETDVFEVPVETVLNKVDLSPPAELDAQNEEMEREMATSNRKKSAMKIKMDELNSDLALVRIKETEMSSKMNQLVEELEQSKSVEAELTEKLEILEAQKNAMEMEMKTMRIQMDQWRKAAEAAAIVLSEETQRNGRVIESIIPDSPGPADDDTADDDDGFAGGKKKGSGIRKFGEMWKRRGVR